MRVLFLRTGESWDVDESNNTTKDTLSIPMINNVIDSRVITVSSVKVGNPNMSTKEDRTSKTIPLNICNERNQLGGTESTISD
jgi:hypothetical protein